MTQKITMNAEPQTQNIFELLTSISNRLDIIEKNTLKNEQSETVIEKSQDVKIAKGMSVWIYGKHRSGKTTLAVDLLKNLYLQYEEIYCTKNLLDIETYVSMPKVKNVGNMDVSDVLYALIKKQKQFLKDNPTKQQNENVLFVIDDLNTESKDIVRMFKDAKEYRIDLIVTSLDDLISYQEQFFDCVFNPMKLIYFNESTQKGSHQQRSVCDFGGKNQLKEVVEFNQLIEQSKPVKYEWLCILNEKYNEKLYSYVPSKL